MIYKGFYCEIYRCQMRVKTYDFPAPLTPIITTAIPIEINRKKDQKKSIDKIYKATYKERKRNDVWFGDKNSVHIKQQPIRKKNVE